MCGANIIEPRHDKTCIRSFRPGPTQTMLYSTEDVKRLGIFDLGSSGIAMSI